MVTIYKSNNRDNYIKGPALIMAPDAVIQSVEFLNDDTDNTSIVTNDLKQYINLPKQDAFVDGTKILNKAQLGQHPRIKVAFDKPGEHTFKLKLVPDASNQVYTASEKTRNTNFVHTEQVLDLTTDSNGEKIIEGSDIKLSAAGNDVFSLQANDENAVEVNSSGKVKNKRMFYLTEAKMQGLTSIASNLNVAEAEYAKHGIDFTILPAVNIPHMPNIGNRAEKDQFKQSVIAAYSASQTAVAKGKYGIAVVYTDQLAVKESNQRVRKFNITGGSPNPVMIAIENTRYQSKSLWHNIVPGEDWFVSCHFIKNGGNPSTDKIIIPKSKCTPIQKVGAAIDNCDYVNVDVSWLPNETGTIKLYVNWVESFKAGLSFGGTNIVAICTRIYWKDKLTPMQNLCVIHELGHQFNMACNGDNTKKLPDATPNYYSRKGSHCHSGIPLQSSKNYHKKNLKKNANCVMYGTLGKSRTAFCYDCSIAIKKVDLKVGV